MDDVYLESEHARIPSLRKHLRFPLAMKLPPRFRVEEPRSLPVIDGSVEFVDGELRWMPPCADYQQDVATEAVRLLGNWTVKHPEFIVAGNAPPVLAVEVAGEDEDEASLRQKAAWYLAHGVQVVWLLFPKTRGVLVLTGDEQLRLKGRARLPSSPMLPGLKLTAQSFFRQL